MKKEFDIAAAKAAARIFLQPEISDPDGGREMMLREALFDAASAHFDPDRAAGVVSKALAGDKEAGEAVRRAAAWYIEHGDTVPEVLKPYVVPFLSGVAVRGKRTSNDNALRNQYIKAAVRAVQGYGFDPTRNRESHAQPSACSIVAEVLAEIGIHMTERNVESICDDRVPE